MKTTDLMIGDWVQNQDGSIKGRIVNIDAYQNRVEFGAHTIDVDFVYPIPLTPKILEKNGFYNSDLVDDYNIAKGIHYNVDSKQILFGSVYKTALEIDCNYVHELQHTLRLCKIEKEIIL